MIALIILAVGLVFLGIWLQLRYVAGEHDRMSHAEYLEQEFRQEASRVRPGSLVDHL
jgi:hypothetical protein